MAIVPLTVDFRIDSTCVCGVTRQGIRRIIEVDDSVDSGDVVYFDEESGQVINSDENGYPQGNKVQSITSAAG